MECSGTRTGVGGRLSGAFDQINERLTETQVRPTEIFTDNPETAAQAARGEEGGQGRRVRKSDSKTFIQGRSHIAPFVAYMGLIYLKGMTYSYRLLPHTSVLSSFESRRLRYFQADLFVRPNP